MPKSGGQVKHQHFGALGLAEFDPGFVGHDGAHVANAGYVVAEPCRRQGIGSRLCQHSLQVARQLGFRAMQFNLVVSTNTAGLRCWQRNGFQVVGTLPGAFRHKRLGYVDALVMIQSLVEGHTP